MPGFSQKGIVSLVSLFLIFAGIAAGVYLVSQQTDIFPEASVKNSGYILKQYPSSDVNITLFDYPGPPYSILYVNGREKESTPSSSYALDYDSYSARTIYVQLLNNKRDEVKDEDNGKNLTYVWTISNPAIASINPYCNLGNKPTKEPSLMEQSASISIGGSTTKSEPSKFVTGDYNGNPGKNGEQIPEDIKKGNLKKDCPENYAYIEPLSEGKTEITVIVSKKNNSPLAKAVFNLTVVKQEPPVICTSDSNCKEGEYCRPEICSNIEIYCAKAPCPSPPCSPAVCTPKPSPIPSCIPRPACLDSRPACKRPEPAEGWCKGGGKMCTLEAKQCPDGSYVARDPSNNCNFATCPGTKACPEDVRVCPDGSNVYRTQPTCNFTACP